MTREPLYKYAKELMDRVGDFLYDPEPVHEPALENFSREELESLRVMLLRIHTRGSYSE